MPGAAPTLLFDRHHLAIYRFLLRSTGEPETAEDLTQEVFLRAVRSAPELDGDPGARAWLFRVARNLLIDRARRSERRPPSRSLETAPDHATPGSAGLRLELERALAALDPTDREVFLMSQVGGLSYAEVAECTGSSAAAVRSRIFRARCRLRQTLSGADSRGGG